MPSVLYLFLFILLMTIQAFSLPVVDSIISSHSDSIKTTHVKTDTTSTDTTAVGKNEKKLIQPNSNQILIPADSSKKNAFAADTVIVEGYYAGFGAGWSLGNIDIIKLWEHSLPDSLAGYNLTINTLQQKPDTSKSDSLLKLGDTANLRFTIKDQASRFNMAFPFSISLTKFRKKDQFTTAIAFTLVSKNQKGSVYLLSDSLNRRVDVRHNFLLYSLSLDFLYKIQIPPVYFNIDEIDRACANIGIGITPLLKIKTNTTISKHADDSRINGIGNIIQSSSTPIDCNGFAASFKTGLSATKHSSNGAIEFGFIYTLSWYDYFIKNGLRMKRGDFYSADADATKSVSFLSNRIDLSITFLRSLNSNKISK